MYTWAGVFLDSRRLDTDLVKRAASEMQRGGKLDVVVAPLPASIPEAERLVCTLYGLAPRRTADLDFVVRFQATDRGQWQHSYGVPPQDLEATTAPGHPLQKYRCVAVGGTWDHMHWGHRLMLTMAAETAQSKVIIGVTASELLVNKKFAEALEPYDARARAAVDFVRMLRPDVVIETHALHDIYGPTATVEDIQALVVSHETSAGGSQVNEKRASLGWNTLDILVVGLVSGMHMKEGGKLSSTDLRREEMGARN